MDPRFAQKSSALAMTCRVEVNIRARAEVVWDLLTNAEGFPRWNSTIARIEGQIREGERLRLHVPGTSRVFTPTVSGVETGRRMIWSDGVAGIFKGVRIFSLVAHGGTSTHFAMEEHFAGVVFALTRRLLPDFRPIFEAYANDLRREAERLAK